VYGFENINAAHGWSMAVLGATIVFCGLAALSFLISQIYKLLEFWEKRKAVPDRTGAAARPVKSPQKRATEAARLPELKELVSIYRPLVVQLEEPFQLALLYEASAKMDLPHTHLSINRLREGEILLALGDGAFSWNSQKADAL